MNLSRYRLAVNNPNMEFQQGGLLSASDASKVASILSDTKLAGLAGQIPAGERIGDIVSQTKNAEYWNELSPAVQDAVSGYLRAKGSIVAFQKALTQTGRTSKEALAIEMQNLPSPLLGMAPANKRRRRCSGRHSCEGRILANIAMLAGIRCKLGRKPTI